MAKQETKFYSDKGEEFDTLQEAEIADKLDGLSEQVKAFAKDYAEANGKTERYESTVYNIVMNYEASKITAPEIEDTAPDIERIA